MALEDNRHITVSIRRSNLESTLLGIAGCMSEFFYQPMPDNPGLSEFFNSFPEGSRHRPESWPDANGLDPTHFYVQNRLRVPSHSDPYIGGTGGRMGISYRFANRETEEGIMTVHLIDNGENVCQQFTNLCYGTLRSYLLKANLPVTEDITLNGQFGYSIPWSEYFTSTQKDL